MPLTMQKEGGLGGERGIRTLAPEAQKEKNNAPLPPPLNTLTVQSTNPAPTAPHRTPDRSAPPAQRGACCDWCARLLSPSPLIWGERRFCDMPCCRAYADFGGTNGVVRPPVDGGDDNPETSPPADTARPDNARAYAVDLLQLRTSDLISHAAGFLLSIASWMAGSFAIPEVRDRARVLSQELLMRATSVKGAAETLHHPMPSIEAAGRADVLRKIGEVRS